MFCIRRAAEIKADVGTSYTVGRHPLAAGLSDMQFVHVSALRDRERNQPPSYEYADSRDD